MVSTSRIDLLEVKPDLYFSLVINSFRNDLFPEGVPRGSCIFGRTHMDIHAGILMDIHIDGIVKSMWSSIWMSIVEIHTDVEMDVHMDIHMDVRLDAHMGVQRTSIC